MEKKVKVQNLISSRVNIDLPEIRLNRVWERKGAVKTIPYDQLEEAMYNPGVEALFTEGILGIDDLETKKELGLEPEDAEEPVNIITLDDQQRKRYLTVMPTGEFKTKVKELPVEQIRELAQYAIDNEIAHFDKAEIIKNLIGTDIISTIQLNKADQAQIKED